MSFGRKHDEKPNDNPGPWDYSPDFRKLRIRSSEATMMPEHSKKRPDVPTPDAGMYDPHKPFGGDNN